jgi:hypothetical protein
MQDAYAFVLEAKSCLPPIGSFKKNEKLSPRLIVNDVFFYEDIFYRILQDKDILTSPVYS